MPKKPHRRATIVIDTSEPKHTAWSFDATMFDSIRQSLIWGDYSLAGFESSVAVERKELNDFVKCCQADWKRFKKELAALADYRFKCIAVEGSADDVFAHRYVSEAHPHSIMGRANSIHLDFGVPVFFWSNRQQARWMSENWLGMVWNTLCNERGPGNEQPKPVRRQYRLAGAVPEGEKLDPVSRRLRGRIKYAKADVAGGEGPGPF